jgi:hypothetical protein
MTKFNLFHLKNEMIFANAFANLFAVTFVHKLMFKAEPLPAEVWKIPVVTVTDTIFAPLAFFLLEHISQKRLAPHFFPDGGLTAIPKTLRIRIRTRLVALLFACNLIPLLTILHLFHRISLKYSDPALAIQQLRPVIYTNTFIFIGFGICLTMLVGRNLTIPFKEIIITLRGVRNGRFDKKVQVTSNDEIGYTGDVINEMTTGLKERERMQQALDLAKEVQQNLLPKSNLKVDGIDIAGKSVYCDETGIVYDPGSDAFSELGGSGIALGVDVEWVYEDNKKTDFSNGQIIFLSTDGIWEARNKDGEMLGKEPILSAIRQNSSSDATQIIEAIFDILDKFIGEVKIEDDITLVIVKM